MGETESDMLSFHVRRVIVTALLLLIYGDGSGTKHTQSASAAEILAVPVSCSILFCTFQILRGAFIYNIRKNLKKKKTHAFVGLTLEL